MNKLDGNFLIKITKDIINKNKNTDIDVSKLIKFRLQDDKMKKGFQNFVEKVATKEMKKEILKHFVQKNKQQIKKTKNQYKKEKSKQQIKDKNRKIINNKKVKISTKTQSKQNKLQK